jgi:hypothetical protein
MTDAEIEQLRGELRMLRTVITTDTAHRVVKARARIGELESELSRARSDLFALITSEATGKQAQQGADYDQAVSNLVSALYAARGKLSDSNVLMTMQVVRDMRQKLGLP